MPPPRTASRTRTDPKLSLADAADYYGCSIRTLRRYISSGDLRAQRVGKRLIRIDRADLDALAQQIPAADKTA